VRIDPDVWATIYESPRRSARAFIFWRGAELARRACLENASPGERWADVGCGTGHLAAELARAGLDVTGVDDDSEMLHAAERRFASDVGRGCLRFRAGAAGELGFDDESLDGVVATSLVGCLEDAPAFFREVHRVLRPAGRAVVTVTNSDSVLHGLNARLSSGGRPSPLVLPVRLHSSSEVVRELERAGLASVEIRYYGCFVGLWDRLVPPRPVALLLERVLNNPVGRRIGRNLLAVARKTPA
jgi:ubiquinone/menaquinone biosynthesis C-methylase UbiE